LQCGDETMSLDLPAKRKIISDNEMSASNKQLRTFLAMLDKDALRAAVTDETLKKVEQMFKRRHSTDGPVFAALLRDEQESLKPHELLYGIATVVNFDGDFEAFLALYAQTKKDLKQTGKSRPKCNVFVDFSAVDLHNGGPEDIAGGVKWSALSYFDDKDKLDSLRNNFIELCAEKLGSAPVVENLLTYYDWFYNVN